MGIEEKTTFTVVCDRCKVPLWNSHSSVRRRQTFASDSDAMREAHSQGWMVTSTQVRCPDCKGVL